MNIFKDLQLNRDYIIEDIGGYLESKNYNYDMEDTFKNVGDIKRLHIKINEDNFFLDFYFKKGNKTTININQGKESDYKQEIAQFLYANQEQLEKKTNYRFDGISKELFETVIEILKDDDLCNSCNSVEPKDPHVFKIYEFYCTNKVKLKITYYKTRTVLLQGIQHKLFLRALSLFYECLDDDGIHKFIRESLNIKATVKDSDINEEFRRIMPNYYLNARERQQYSIINKLIEQSIIDVNKNVEMKIYDPLVFCAYKALEAQLQITLNDSGVEREKKCNGDFEYRRFDIFDCSSTMSNYILREDVKKKIKNKHVLEEDHEKYINYIEETYKLYARRNRLFHANTQPEYELDQTFFIDNLSEAKEEILTILEQIDLYHEI